ncbi:MAG: flagellar biosynthetic protein FliO [Melioribacteraceae bacterium]
MKTWDIVQIFIILAVMSGIMYGLLFLVKKYLYTFDKKGTNSSRVKIISTQTILPKKFVSVIQFNNNVYLLGVSEQSINLIDKIDENIFVQETTNNSEKPKLNFLNLLKANMGIK